MCYNVLCCIVLCYILYVILCYVYFTLYDFYHFDKELPLAPLPSGTRPFRTWIRNLTLMIHADSFSQWCAALLSHQSYVSFRLPTPTQLNPPHPGPTQPDSTSPNPFRHNRPNPTRPAPKDVAENGLSW